MTQKYAIILLFPMAGCGWGHWLYDKNTYEARLAELTDQDGDGFSSVEGDCDDTDASIYPNAEEVCDGKDNRCEGVVDAGEHLVGAPVWFLDSDQDGHGDDSRSLSACIPPEGYIDQGGDCDDLAVHISPDAAEICNDFIDNDCDGTDNGCALQGSLTTEDADHFFFGSAAGDGIGVSLADGDLNGDGYGDLLIGATHGNAAYVASGRDLEVVTFLTEDEGALVRGASLSDDYILAQAVGICDVDQDGWQDALVSGLHYGARSDLWIFDGPLHQQPLHGCRLCANRRGRNHGFPRQHDRLRRHRRGWER